MGPTLRVRLDPMPNSPLLLSNCTICMRNDKRKRSKIAHNVCTLCQKPQNRERAVSWAMWLKPDFRGHLVHPPLPTFCGFQALESPNKTPRPPYHWSLGGARGQPGPRMVGANCGSGSVPEAKNFFSKFVPRPLGMFKQVSLAHFEPMVTRFGPWKVPKCLENGLFWGQKWIKNGSKTRFSKSDL